MLITRLTCILSVCILTASVCLGQQAVKKMTNQDILDMASLGLGDDVILEKIRSAPETDFATDLGSLKALKAAHLSDPVIRAMINPKAAAAPSVPAAAVAAPANPDLPDDVGIYLKVRGKLNEVTPEVVGYKTGGVLKSMATYGMDKGHRNGTVQGPKSA